MHTALAPLHAIFVMNTRLFAFCLEEMTDEIARSRVSPNTNHAYFLACHLVDARYFLGRMLGYTRSSPLADALESAQSIDDLAEPPPLSELLDVWQVLSDELGQHLTTLSDDALTAKAPQDFPLPDNRMLGAIAFLLQHESFHLGQMALLRKAAGLSPMRYS